MRILWVNHRDPRHPQAGGAEVRLYEVARRLARMGHSVTVLAEKVTGLPASETIDGVTVKRLGGKLSIHVLAPLYLRRHKDDYDVVIDDIAHAIPWASPLATKKPVIAQVHHVHQEVLYTELPKPLAWLAARSERLIPRLYKHIIAVSNSTKQELVERLGASPESITVIPNGVDASKYKPGPKHPKPTILWVGRIKRYKNLDHLLKAYKQVKEEEPDAQLVIIGTGDHEHAMKRLARRLELRDAHFLGRQPEEEKIKWMQRAWLIASTSMKEGWGLTILEAAACKTPAVAYNVPGLRDAVKHMETGILTPPGDTQALAKAILLLLQDENLRRKLAENAYQNARHYTWDKTAEKFNNIMIKVAF